MKKKSIIIIVFVILLILLFPIKKQLNDGGTKEYKSLVYKVSKIHRFVSESDLNEYIKPYEDGIIIEILGFEIFNNVK